MFDASRDTGQDGLAASTARFAGFAGKTRIKTLRGEVAAETLRRGDRILTRDNGYQALLWTGQYHPPSSPDVCIRIRKGALGRAMPERGLRVGPDQQFLIGGGHLRKTSGQYSGQSEALVSASDLTCLVGVSRQDKPAGPLVLILLDRHELILANGTWCASFRPMGLALNVLSPSARHDLFHLLTEPVATAYPSARQRLDQTEVRKVLGPFRRSTGKSRSGHA
ncbi:Hint domain-containing protein [Antarctobacter jejuensis]|uniref:Hint domain-containing protein n=1 Tax=Antarctobacter jejuensis TaxID=1439938 RepID=UPI003FD471FB